SGQIIVQRDSVRANIVVHDVRSAATLATAEAEARTGDLNVVRDLARRLAAGVLDNDARYIEAAAARSTESLPALRAFISGERDFHDGRYDAAAASFRTAVARDSAFALAHYRLALSMV